MIQLKILYIEGYAVKKLYEWKYIFDKKKCWDGWMRLFSNIK